MIYCGLREKLLLFLIAASMLALNPMSSFPQGAETTRQQEAASELRFQQLWDSADIPHVAGNYAQSELKYKEILAEFPTSQRAALRIAIAQEKQGKPELALASYDDALAIDPKSDWATFVLFYKARAAHEAGKDDVCRQTCSLLARLHPDSPFMARAELLKATMDGKGIDAARSALDLELKAAEDYERAISNSGRQKDEEVLRQLDEMIDRYPDTHCVLRAREARAHTLIRLKRHDEALDEFQSLLLDLDDTSGDSRIAGICLRRIAGIQHLKEQREDALETFQHLISTADSPDVQDEATLQSMGLLFELIQQDLFNGVASPKDNWEEFDRIHATLTSSDSVDKAIKARADLMFLESQSYRGRFDSMPDLADAFLEQYTEAAFLRERATVCYFMGDMFEMTRKYEDAIPFFKLVLEMYPSETDIWPTMHHLELTYEKLADCLFMLEREQEARGILKEMKERFPSSEYVESVENKLRIGHYQRVRMRLQNKEQGI